MQLSDAARETGYRLEARARTGSTSDDAAAALRGGDPGGLWVTAREQGQGRGRHGRPWSSPQGNLYASLALVEPCAMREAPQLGYLAGLALVEAVETLAPARVGARLALKWPNDLLLDDAKCAGILLDGIALGPGRFGLVVGIGVNVAHAPEGMPYPVACLRDLVPGLTAEALFEALSAAMALRLAALAGADPKARFARLREEWLERAARLGEPVRIRLPAGDAHGRFVGLDEHGRLLLASDDGVTAIEAGDLQFSRETCE